MPRDAFSNYSLPAGNPVVTGTTIASSWANTTLNDIATALTQSLSTDGSTATVNMINKTMNNGNYGLATFTSITINNVTINGTGNWNTTGTITATGTITGGSVVGANVTANTSMTSNGTLTVSGATNLAATNINGLLFMGSGQIQFPATQIPSANPNILDDYEEGSWTPTYTYSTPGTASFSYSSRSGVYTKIGNLVTVCVALSGTPTIGTGAGAIQITGLPFANGIYVCSSGIQLVGLQQGGTTRPSVSMIVDSASSNLSFWSMSPNTTDGATSVNLTAGNFPSGSAIQITGSITYRV